MYDSESYWSEYTQQEKHVIYRFLFLFLAMLNEDIERNGSYIREPAKDCYHRTQSILKALFKDKTDEEILNAHIEDPCYIIKSMSQSKKDKLFNCLINTRNKYDIMLTLSRSNIKDLIINTCNDVNYKLNYDIFN